MAQSNTIVRLPRQSSNIITMSGGQITAEEIANAEAVLERGMAKKLGKLSVLAKRALCARVLKIPDAESMTEDAVAQALHQYVSHLVLACNFQMLNGPHKRVDRGIIDKEGNLLTDSLTKGKVLGRNTMARVWEDMEVIILPSWMAAVPRRVGASMSSTSLGLGADQWRTFCTVHLVTTLGYDWGQMEQDSREHQLLSNFMQLVAAVKLALARITTPSRRDKCRNYLVEYLTGMLELFPGTTIQSNQHVCVHIPDILARAGPGPGISAWPFERGIGDLQKSNNNNRIGEWSCRNDWSCLTVLNGMRTAHRPARINHAPCLLQPAESTNTRQTVGRL